MVHAKRAKQRLPDLNCQVPGSASRDPGGNHNWEPVRGDGEASVTASDLVERLERQGKEDVPVEEHDHSWYIAHLGTDDNVWVVIEETSPLYEGFRQCHAAWQMNQSQN